MQENIQGKWDRKYDCRQCPLKIYQCCNAPWAIEIQTSNCKKQTTKQMQQRTNIRIFTWHSVPTSLDVLVSDDCKHDDEVSQRHVTLTENLIRKKQPTQCLEKKLGAFEKLSSQLWSFQSRLLCWHEEKITKIRKITKISPISDICTLWKVF